MGEANDPPAERPGAEGSRVMELAQAEARRLHHDAVGPCHLLVAFAADGRTLAGRVLRELGAGALRLRNALERARPPGENEPGDGCRLPVEPSIKTALERSLVLAGDGRPGTGHLLLAVLEACPGHAAPMLRHLGLDPETVRHAVVRRMTEGPARPDAEGAEAAQAPEAWLGAPFTSRARSALRAATELACQGLGLVTPLHLLHGALEAFAADGTLAARMPGVARLDVLVKVVREAALEAGTGGKRRRGPVLFAPSSLAVLAVACMTAADEGATAVGADDLVMALLGDEGSSACALLCDVSLVPEEVRTTWRAHRPARACDD